MVLLHSAALVDESSGSQDKRFTSLLHGAFPLAPVPTLTQFKGLSKQETQPEHLATNEMTARKMSNAARAMKTSQAAEEAIGSEQSWLRSA